MKKINLFFAFCSLLLVPFSAQAQTLNVEVGNVTYQFPAEQAGVMPYSSGTTLTVLNKAFTLSDVTAMYIDNTAVTDNTVSVDYSGTTAKVKVAGNVAQYLTVAYTNAHVSIVQSADLAQEITYTLSGTSTDGGFYMEGSYKATVELSGLTLTNASAVYSGAAVHIQNGKRIKVKVVTGTTNTLKDASSGSQKGSLYIKGHAEFAQKGTLNVYGYVKHAIKAGEYISVKNCTINVLSAVGDGINCEQYFLMTSGEINISGVGDDGLQCDIEDTTTGSTGETADHEDEDSGNVYIEGGTLNINCSATGSKGIKAAGDVIVTDGTVNVTTTGNGVWDATDKETKAACGISSDANITISGGQITLKSSGSGGKGMKCDSVLTISGDNTVIDITTTGGMYYSNGSTENHNYTGNTDRLDSNYYSSPKGIKAGLKTESGSSGWNATYTYAGGLVINGGTITVTTSGNNAEGIESKNDMTINGGTVTVNSYDDGINSARNMYLKGGTITVVAKNNDAIDANANMYISGGTVMAFGAGGAECGLDAAEGYSLYITGGTVLAAGGNNNSVSSTTGSQALLSASITLSAGSTVTVKQQNSSTALCSFLVPDTYTGSSQGGFFAPMAGPGGQGGPGGQSGRGSAALILATVSNRVVPTPLLTAQVQPLRKPLLHIKECNSQPNTNQ
ncbi:MAG: carbohydrate-binding domain-containing protein [Paludibacteraceae bacterium]|nr:carbohydrate-binding domain-containing protein [Paludibacteraceae bacterium]